MAAVADTRLLQIFAVAVGNDATDDLAVAFDGEIDRLVRHGLAEHPAFEALAGRDFEAPKPGIETGRLFDGGVQDAARRRRAERSGARRCARLLIARRHHCITHPDCGHRCALGNRAD